MKKMNCITCFVLAHFMLQAQTPTLPSIELVEFATGFNQPVGLEHAGENRLFVLEQTGKIKILEDGWNQNAPFLNLSDKVLTAGFEQGLLGMAFDPDYAENGYFYVHYTNLDGDSRFSRFSVNPHNPNKALPGSEVILLEVDDPFSNHNGGQMKFGPDGYLYFTIGDGGAGGDPFNNAQDPGILLGKLLRIDPSDDGTYEIPPTNPFVGVPGYMEEIWATGLRNPWRFSFDLLSGDLWIADVGQNIWEEVNYQSSTSSGGENYGWSCLEGNHPFKMDCDDNGTPFTAPIAEYEHSDDPMFFCSGSVTGGYVYRGALFPDMYGKYFYTDFCTGVIRTTYWDGLDWVSAELGNFTPFAYSTFGEDIKGELYLVNKTSGTIYHFTDGGTPALTQISNDIEPAYEYPLRPEMLHSDQPDVDLDEWIIESITRPFNGVTQRLEAGNQYSIVPNPNQGSFTVHFTADQPELYSVGIYDIMSRQVHSDIKDGREGPNDWQLNSSWLSEGIYFLQIRSNKEISTCKFVVE